MLVTSLLIVLAIFLLWAVYAASGAIVSLLKQRTAASCLDQAGQRAREGDLSGALALYLKAEASWTLDAEHRNRATTLSDLDRYGQIAAGIASAVGREASTAHADIRATLRELRELTPHRSSFGVDGNAQASQALVRWNASRDRLEMLRAKLRATCDPRILR